MFSACFIVVHFSWVLLVDVKKFKCRFSWQAGPVHWKIDAAQSSYPRKHFYDIKILLFCKCYIYIYIYYYYSMYIDIYSLNFHFEMLNFTVKQIEFFNLSM